LKSTSPLARARIPPAHLLLRFHGALYSRVHALLSSTTDIQKTGESQKGQGLCSNLLIQSGSTKGRQADQASDSEEAVKMDVPHYLVER
jgi:hypothetical protein